jgi:hypothetical protein
MSAATCGVHRSPDVASLIRATLAARISSNHRHFKRSEAIQLFQQLRAQEV